MVYSTIAWSGMPKWWSSTGAGLATAGACPSAPLRESLARLGGVAAVVFNGGRSVPLPVGLPGFDMDLVADEFVRLDAPGTRCPVAELAGRMAGKTFHAVAGIGDPGRFFRTLDGLGLSFVPHPFPDHHAYRATDLDFGADAVVLMTEKDAVKCRDLNLGETWVLPVQADLPPALVETLLEKISGRPAS